MLRGWTARVLAAACLVALAGQALLPAPQVHGTEAAAPIPPEADDEPGPAPGRVPVVLVHGIRSAEDTWGSPDGRGLLGALVRQGYEPGRTLFWSEADPWRDPVRAAQRELAPLLRRAAAAAGTTAVDIVAHTSGALLVQHLLHTDAPPIRQVVLIAPFSAGHDGAALAREAAFRAALLDWHWRGRLARNTGLPRAGDPPGAAPGPAAGEPPAAAASFDEAAFVVARAYEFYEPTYHRFVREAWFLRPPDDPRPSPDFWRWLAAHEPDLHAVLTTQAPPVPGGPPGWEAGTDLTRAYYERTAFEAARAVYHSLRPVAEVLLEDWQDDVDLDFSDGWVSVVARFLGRRLAHLLASYAAPWFEHGRDAALVALFSGSTGASPLTTPVRRLEPLADNLWLRAIRLPGGWDARPQGPRVVSIGGRVTGPLAALLPAPEDLGADATLPWPADLDDAGHEVSGWWGVDVSALARHRGVIQRVIEELGRWEQVPTVTVRGGGAAQRRVTAGVAGPTYLRSAWLPTAPGGDSSGAPAHLSATLEPAAGLEPASGTLAAWAVDPATGRRVVGLARAAGPGRPVTLDLPPGAVIGVRLLPAAGAGGAAAAAGSVAVRVTLTPADPAAAAVPSPASPAPPASQPAPPPAPAPPAPGTGPVDPPAPVPAPWSGWEGDPGAGLPGDLPLIRVVLRSRLTTDKRERREHHGRWVWDFGDGAGYVDDDPDHVVTEVAHRYRRPGRYTVTAQAESNQGRTIRTLTWQVDVPEDLSQTLYVFPAESIREPRVDLDLQGPVEWVVGRPAVFALAAAIEPPPFGEVVEVRHYPGERFAVLWERPGDEFVVRAAVWVKVRYTFPEGRRFTVQNIYTVERSVNVLALGSDGR